MGGVYRNDKSRLTKEPSLLMQKTCQPGTTEDVAGIYATQMPRLNAFHIIDKAHLLTLYKAGYLPLDETAKIFSVFRELERDEKVAEARLHTSEPALLHSGEAILTEKLGHETGGRIHLGRSSGDLNAGSYVLTLREKTIRIMEALMELRKVILHLAEEHVDTVMASYTHMQQAQPTTLGHYYSYWAYALQRDFERLTEFYRRLNTSVMGAAIIVGSEFGLNREYEARLLGFDSVRVNTMDAVWGRDINIESYTALLPLSSDIGRICQDIELWTSSEFGYMQVDDSHAGTSSIMPQKKNPFGPEFVKGNVAVITGGLVASVMTWKDFSTGAVMEWIRTDEDTWRLYDEFVNVLLLTAEIERKLTVNREEMLKKSNLMWTTATDLAGMMVKKLGIPWRKAHQITAIAVRMAMEKGITPETITAEDINVAAAEYDGSNLKISTEWIREALDPVSSVRNHDMIGGPSPSRVLRDLEEPKKRYQEDLEAIRLIKERINSGAVLMESEIDKLLAENAEKNA